MTNSMANDDFIAELPSSYQFKLQVVDRAKLQQIRTAKNNKSRARQFEQMGIPIEENIIRPRKIFLSKNKQMKNMTNKVLDTTGIYFY